jgi:hypothetical protein
MPLINSTISMKSSPQQQDATDVITTVSLLLSLAENAN